MGKRYFNCPDCGKPIAFDSWDDIFDIRLVKDL